LAYHAPHEHKPTWNKQQQEQPQSTTKAMR
jgi:hypothetical protein